MRYRNGLRAVAVLAVVTALGIGPAAAKDTAKPAKTKCDLTFSLTEWAVAYKHASGSGVITCDNGQKQDVLVTSKGVGLTAGKFKIDGKGEFSKVADIKDLLGNYAAAQGDAGIVKAGAAAVVTKGDVSLAISGHGEGWNVGVSVGNFELKPAKH